MFEHKEAEFELIDRAFNEKKQQHEALERETELEVQGYKEWLAKQSPEAKKDHEQYHHRHEVKICPNCGEDILQLHMSYEFFRCSFCQYEEPVRTRITQKELDLILAAEEDYYADKKLQTKREVHLEFEGYQEWLDKLNPEAKYSHENYLK